MATPYLGEIKLFAGNFPIRGWMFCNGQLLAISQYDALYFLIGTTYGGDGVNTFALPDLQGRVNINMGTGPGLSPYVIGQTGGQENVLLTSSTIAAHNHGVYTSSGTGVASPTGALLADATNGQTNGSIYGTGGTNVQLSAGTIDVGPGGNQPHNNIQPVLALNYLIAVEGVFPSRN